MGLGGHLSATVVAEMSPYPTVARVVKAQYMEAVARGEREHDHSLRE